jgi:hypothetical protein
MAWELRIGGDDAADVEHQIASECETFVARLMSRFSQHIAWARIVGDDTPEYSLVGHVAALVGRPSPFVDADRQSETPPSEVQETPSAWLDA